jgi:negative regulator of genetic competence, sporulation and motility
LEFLLVGESKIKIVLTKKEAEQMHLGQGDVSSADSRRAFWQLISTAKKEVGFDPKGDKLLIQLYPMKEGVEIFVTKLGLLPDSSAKMVSRSNRVSLLSKKRCFYALDSLDNLVAAARAVRATSEGVEIESDVYLSQDRYFLSIEEYGKGGEVVEFPCILEFATPLAADLSAYIIEHATCLTEGDGVKKFSAL